MKYVHFLIAAGGLLILALQHEDVAAQTTTLPEMPNDVMREEDIIAQSNTTNSGSNATTTSPFSITPTEMPEFMPFMDQQPLQEPNTSSVELFPLIMQSIKSEINTTLNEAIDTAINSVNTEGNNNSTNIIPIYSAIETERGAIVYRVFVVDQDNMVHMVTVDPGNGQVLSVDIVPNEVATSMIMASSGGLGGGGGFGPALGPGIMLG